MQSDLPYTTTNGNIAKAFQAIKKVPRPEKLSQNFVKTKLSIPGSSGDSILVLLKRLGFADATGTPSDLYDDLRSSGKSRYAVASGIRIAYSRLYEHNEYFHDANETEQRDIIARVTGETSESKKVGRIFNTFSALTNEADFAAPVIGELDSDLPEPIEEKNADQDTRDQRQFGFQFGTNIHLNLPDTSDPEVFDAIFSSLKKHLL